MAEVTGIAPVFRESPPIPISLPDRTEANSYGTKAVYDLTIDGTQTQWHSVKGGRSLERDALNIPLDSLKFGVLFDPRTKSWLKIVPPETTGTPFYEGFEQRLKKAADQQRAALQIAGLPDLASQVRDVDIEMRGRKFSGYTVPHIGPSLEFMLFKLTGQRTGRVTNPDAADLLSHAYSTATDQAEKLYLQFGIWTDDPNPGNILLRPDENGIHVVLIDFTNRTQEAEYLYSRLSRDRYPGDAYTAKVKSMLVNKIKDIHRNFRNESESRGIPFTRDLKETEVNIDNSVAIVNARRLIAQPQEALH